jgi:hypothetical protein
VYFVKSDASAHTVFGGLPHEFQPGPAGKMLKILRQGILSPQKLPFWGIFQFGGW